MRNITRIKLFCQEIIHGCLNEQLGGKVYDASKVSQWSKAIADNVKSQVKTLGYDRYKIVVEVVFLYRTEFVTKVVLGCDRRAERRGSTDGVPVSVGL